MKDYSDKMPPPARSQIRYPPPMPPVARATIERLIARSERVTNARVKSLMELRERLGKRAPLRDRKPKKVTPDEYARAMAEAFDREGEVREVLFLDAEWHFKTNEPWFQERRDPAELRMALSEANHPDHALGLAWSALTHAGAGEGGDWEAVIEECLAWEERLDADFDLEGKELDAAYESLAQHLEAGAWQNLYDEAAPRYKKFPANPTFRRFAALGAAGLGRTGEAVDLLWPDLEIERPEGGEEGARTVAAGLLMAGLALAESGKAFTPAGDDIRAEARSSLYEILRRDARLGAFRGPVVEAAPPPPPSPPPILLDELDEVLLAGGPPELWLAPVARAVGRALALRIGETTVYSGDASARAALDEILAAGRDVRGPRGAGRRIGEGAYLAVEGALEERAWEGFERAARRIQLLLLGGAKARAIEEAFARARARLQSCAAEPPERLAASAERILAEIPSPDRAARPDRVAELNALRERLLSAAREAHAVKAAPPALARWARAAASAEEEGSPGIRARRRAFASLRFLPPREAARVADRLAAREPADAAALRARARILASARAGESAAELFTAIRRLAEPLRAPAALPMPATSAAAAVGPRRRISLLARLHEALRELPRERLLPEDQKEARGIERMVLQSLAEAAAAGATTLDDETLRHAVASLATGEKHDLLRRLVERATQGNLPEDPTVAVAYASALAKLGAPREAEEFLARYFAARPPEEWRTLESLLAEARLPPEIRDRIAGAFAPPPAPPYKPLAGKKIGFLSNFDNWRPYVARIVEDLGGEVVWLGGVRNHWKDYVPHLRNCDAVVRFIRTMYHHDPGFEQAVEAAGAKGKVWTYPQGGVSALRNFLIERAPR